MDVENINKLIGQPLGIGSMPQKEADAAVEMILEYLPDSPFWPELPRRDFRERMGYIQSRGLPGLVVDEKAKKIYLDERRDYTAEIAEFYQNYLDGDYQSAALTEEYAAGWRALKNELKKRSKVPVLIKAQLSGPTTLGLILKDSSGKALLYNEQYRDVLVKSTQLTAKWMATTIKDFGSTPVIFFDEPMLQSVGSPTVPIKRSEAVDFLKEAAQGVDAVVGAHCCGNTDWTILMDAGLDVIAFDAYHFAATMALYPDKLNNYLDQGGLLAWGIVPAAEEVLKLRRQDLRDRLRRAFKTVADGGVSLEKLQARALFSPSCGLGSLSLEAAEQALRLTAGFPGDVLY